MKGTPFPLLLGADHAGFRLKESLKERLSGQGATVTDAGVSSDAASDYPDVAIAVAEKVAAGLFPRAILLCGSGVGMCMVANRFPGVRAALCSDPEGARLSRRHNDANILCLAARRLDDATARDIEEAWLDTDFEGGRHQVRIDKIRALEQRLYR